MLPRQYRLNKDSDFARIFKQGKRVSGKYFGLVYLPSAEGVKVGVVVSNKVSKSAVERNRIKRLVKAAVESRLTRFKNVFLIVSTKRNASDTEKEILREDLEALLNAYEKISSS